MPLESVFPQTVNYCKRKKNELDSEEIEQYHVPPYVMP